MESMVRISSIEEQLDYLMGQQKKHTIAFQNSLLEEYIDKACGSLSPHLHNGGTVFIGCPGTRNWAAVYEHSS